MLEYGTMVITRKKIVLVFGEGLRLSGGQACQVMEWGRVTGVNRLEIVLEPSTTKDTVDSTQNDRHESLSRNLLTASNSIIEGEESSATENEETKYMST